MYRTLTILAIMAMVVGCNRDGTVKRGTTLTPGSNESSQQAAPTVEKTVETTKTTIKEPLTDSGPTIAIRSTEVPSKSSQQPPAATTKETEKTKETVTPTQPSKPLGSNSYSPEFELFWGISGDREFVRNFSQQFGNQAGFELNKAQTKYVQEVVLPEFKNVAYEEFRASDGNTNAVFEKVGEHLSSSAINHVNAIRLMMDDSQKRALSEVASR
jgi:hypothetical protein